VLTVKGGSFLPSFVLRPDRNNNKQSKGYPLKREQQRTKRMGWGPGVLGSTPFAFGPLEIINIS
jgi:hypothetical protein